MGTVACLGGRPAKWVDAGPLKAHCPMGPLIQDIADVRRGLRRLAKGFRGAWLKGCSKDGGWPRAARGLWTGSGCQARPGQPGSGLAKLLPGPRLAKLLPGPRLAPGCPWALDWLWLPGPANRQGHDQLKCPGSPRRCPGAPSSLCSAVRNGRSPRWRTAGSSRCSQCHWGHAPC